MNCLSILISYFYSIRLTIPFATYRYLIHVIFKNKSYNRWHSAGVYRRYLYSPHIHLKLLTLVLSVTKHNM